MTPPRATSSGDPESVLSVVRQHVEAGMAADPRTAEITDAERELVVAALEGASLATVAMLTRIEALCESSTTGMVSVTALRRAIAGTEGDGGEACHA